MSNWLRPLILVCLFAVLFVPLLVADGGLLPNMFFPFITGKAFVFRFLVQLAAAAWLILLLWEPKYRVRRNLIITVLMAFLLTLGVSTILAENPQKSFWSNFERMEGYITILHLALYTLVLSSMLQSASLWRRFFNTSLIANAIILLYALLQLFGQAEIHQGADRLTASLGNASYLAVYTLVHIFIAAYLLFTSDRRQTVYRWILGVSVLINLVVLINTGTRGALIGLVAGVVVSLIITYATMRSHPQVKRVIGGAFLLMLILGAGFMAMRQTTLVKSNPVLSRYSSISIQDALPRLLVWKIALKGAAERPIFGWGQDNFNYVFNKYYNPQLHEQEEWFDRAHNVLMDWLIAGGVLALLAYLALFIVMARSFYKERKEQPILYAIMTGALVAYFINNLFVFDHLASYLLFFSLLAFGIFLERSRSALNKDKSLDPRSIPLGTAIILILFVTILYVTVVKPAVAAQNLVKAISTDQKLSPQINLEVFQKMASSSPAYVLPEMRERLFEYTLQTAVNPAIPNNIKQQFVDLTVTQYDQQLKNTPDDTRYHFFLGLFWQQLGQHQLALQFLERALELSPNKQSIMYSIGTSLRALGKQQESLEYFKRAFELEPKFARPRINYAVALIHSGQVAAADELLLEGFKTTNVDTPELLNAYIATRMYDRVLLFWQQAVSKEPQNPDKRLSLAAAYLFVGQRERAIAEIERAVEIDPARQAQGKYLISEIRAGRNPAQQ